MRTKWLVFMVSLILLLSLNVPVSADWYCDGWVGGPPPCQQDACFDTFIPDKDLYMAKVEVFPQPDGFIIPEWIYLCIQMCEGSTLPGLVVWEFDVDWIPTTGDPQSLLGAWGIKPAEGKDLIIAQVFRDQGFGSITELCGGCWNFGCITQPRAKGEWWALIDWPTMVGPECALDYASAVDWGRDIPKPPEVGTDYKYCTKLPWREIIEKAMYYEPMYAGWPMAAIVPPLWQVSTWYDPVFADGDDYITGLLPGAAPDITDWLPNPDFLNATGQESDGGDCAKFQYKYHCCLDQIAAGATCDSAVCNNFTDSTACTNAGCVWNTQGLPPPGTCQSAICLADSDFSGRITGGDLTALKRDLARMDCPCGQ